MIFLKVGKKKLKVLTSAIFFLFIQLSCLYFSKSKRNIAHFQCIRYCQKMVFLNFILDSVDTYVLNKEFTKCIKISWSNYDLLRDLQFIMRLMMSFEWSSKYYWLKIRLWANTQPSPAHPSPVLRPTDPQKRPEK